MLWMSKQDRIVNDDEADDDDDDVDDEEDDDDDVRVWGLCMLIYLLVVDLSMILIPQKL